jgi:hypothetical protein
VGEEVNAVAPKTLAVDLAELSIALEAEASDLTWFLDLDTGDVILVTREYDASDYGGLTVDDIEGTPQRFLKVPAGDPLSTVNDMHSFAAQVADQQLKESLELALSAPRPDRRFRAVLGWLPSEQEHWHEFRAARCEERARGWLTTLGIQPAPRARAARE